MLSKVLPAKIVLEARLTFVGSLVVRHWERSVFRVSVRPVIFGAGGKISKRKD